jgi:hypothetical protein
MITMSDLIAREALDAAPPFPRPGVWTPLAYDHAHRADAAYAIASAVRTSAHMLTLEERTRLAVELLTPHSTDHARDSRFEEYTG